MFIFARTMTAPYQILQTSHPLILERLFAFRYQSYCLWDHLLSPLDYPEEIEYDPYDFFSVHLVAFNPHREIIGCVRLINAAATILPTEKEFELTQSLAYLTRSELQEISRLIVAPSYRRSLLLFDLIRAAFFCSQQQKVSYWLGCMEDHFSSRLGNLFGELTRLSQSRSCFNAENTPFLISLDFQYQQTLELSRRGIQRKAKVPPHIILNLV